MSNEGGILRGRSRHGMSGNREPDKKVQTSSPSAPLPLLPEFICGKPGAAGEAGCGLLTIVYVVAWAVEVLASVGRPSFEGIARYPSFAPRRFLVDHRPSQRSHQLGTPYRRSSITGGGQTRLLIRDEHRHTFGGTIKISLTHASHSPYGFNSANRPHFSFQTRL
ncbi:hypothetical protein DFH08DRAFT_827850 [Mycena albidolilacea]|uniref:Uncharacterized protein n=1 Tax=Mycena albidolilacea TaxID=1033008 RepID=A0AAD6YX91_9AGAR|nr:hypothetical protein DFH08DRAFT_827850 [Mycena albidolilacea]